MQFNVRNLTHYAGLMLDALTIELWPKLCQHNLSEPSYYLQKAHIIT